MQAKGKWAIAVGLIALILIGVRALLFSGPPDSELIRQTIRDAVQASKDGKPGGVLEQLSNSFQFNDGSWDRRQVSEVIKNSRPEITLFNLEPVINGDTATVISRAQVRGKYLLLPISVDIPSVKIELKQGTELRYGIVPMKKWQITSVSAPGFSGAELMPQ